jgi:hypothetical protein
VLFRSVVTPSLLKSVNKLRVAQWVRQLDYVRVFMNDSSVTTKGTPKSRQVPQVDAPMVFSRLAESSFRFTVLMNHLEHIDKNLLDIRSSLKVPYAWRVDDLVVTYSSIGSGIGYHAGHEDAFIVQASGQRRWQVWDGACTGEEVPPLVSGPCLLELPGNEPSLSLACRFPWVDPS